MNKNIVIRLVALLLSGFLIMGLIGFDACSSPQSTPITYSPQWSPDSSKIIRLPRADLQQGTKISIPTSDMRIIPFTVELGEKQVACVVETVEGKPVLSCSLRDSSGNILKTEPYIWSGPDGIDLVAGAYYLYINNQSGDPHSATVLLRLIWRSGQAPIEEPANLPLTGEVKLTPYSNEDIALFYETLYGASTYRCVHHSSAVNLSKGQSIHLIIESDTNINWNENPSSNARPELYVLFAELTTYYGFKWCTMDTRGIESKQIITSNGGKRLEAILTIIDVTQPDSNNQGLYKLLLINMDTKASHSVKYTIFLESG